MPSGEESPGTDESLPSSCGSASTNNRSTNTNTNASMSTTQELEERFQKALTLEDETQNIFLEDAQVDQVTQKELDALYAKDMFELTGQERDEALHDIHGVSDVIEESPEFVQQQRTLLEQELSMLESSKLAKDSNKTHAYRLAKQQNAEYLQSAEFQLLFLRADRWDAHDAAERIVQFLDMKLSLFGSELLTRHVTISDLSKDDWKSLDSGFFQLLPVRDAGGRAILVAMPMIGQYKHIDNLVGRGCFVFIPVRVGFEH